MHFLEPLLAKGTHNRRMRFDCSAVQVVSKEYGDLVALQTLLVAVKFFIVLEKVDIEIEAALAIVLIYDGEDLFQDIGIGHLDSEQHEYLDFF